MTDFPPETIEDLQRQMTGNREDLEEYNRAIRDRFEALYDKIQLLAHGMQDALAKNSVESLVEYFDSEMQSEVKYDRFGDITFDVSGLIEALSGRENAQDGITYCEEEIAELADIENARRLEIDAERADIEELEALISERLDLDTKYTSEFGCLIFHSPDYGSVRLVADYEFDSFCIKAMRNNGHTIPDDVEERQGWIDYYRHSFIEFEHVSHSDGRKNTWIIVPLDEEDFIPAEIIRERRSRESK